MKLVRYGAPGAEQPGLIDGGDTLRSLSFYVDDIGPAQLDPDALAELAKIDPADLPVVDGPVRLGVPFAGSRKFLAIGLNYADHAAESNMPVPSEPILFTKAISCLQGPDDPILIPPGAEKVDWEVELGVVIGRRATHVAEAEALSFVAGYSVVNDVSERAYQLERGGSWDKGKGCDTFGPVGPWLVTADEVPDPQDLDLWLDVDGVRMQTGNTRTMVFGVAFLVSYVSRFITLEPGDIIATGTPPGVGMGRTPQVFLRPGNVVTLGIAGLGSQRQDVIG
jgi:2-keto-4-pentenoate hydratase/2-oxohepta-3-ene-1,7-dioic acid hydratase in catechol pathway